MSNLTCRHCGNPRLGYRTVCPHCRCGYDVSSYGPGESFGTDVFGAGLVLAGCVLFAVLTVMFCIAYANLGGS